jgi:iron complex transport system substrate-binding protein
MARTITDSIGRHIRIQKTPAHVICSGAGALRLLTYFQSQDRIVAVDSIETRMNFVDARPYALANPQFKRYPIFGEYRGNDNPERIVCLNPQPDVIFKTFADMGYNPEELQHKTQIPVVVLNYGDLSHYRSGLYQSIHVMGDVLNKAERAIEITSFFDQLIADLKKRTTDIKDRQSCYIGGVAYKGIQNFQSTEPVYPPFAFTQTHNVAFDEIGKHLSHSYIAKEKLIEWNPEYIFVDLASLTADSETNVLYELKNDPVYQHLNAVKQRNVYGVLPYNGYAQNFGSTLANAYFVGKLLYPNRFVDIDPSQKADEIYSFLIGKPVLQKMNEKLHGLVFQKVIKG